jgi:glutathione peroxidase
MSQTESLFELGFTDNHGQQVDLGQYAGKPVLVVNTASNCGFTPQYDGLQELHEKFREQGLVVIGFPCDQFAHQEPGDDEQIEEFCRVNHGVTFPLSTKVEVNGPRTHPVFEFVKGRTGGLLGTRVKWNFTKFLVHPDGRTVTRFSPRTTPDQIVGDIEKAISEQQPA